MERTHRTSVFTTELQVKLKKIRLLNVNFDIGHRHSVEFVKPASVYIYF